MHWSKNSLIAKAGEDLQNKMLELGVELSISCTEDGQPALLMTLVTDDAEEINAVLVRSEDRDKGVSHFPPTMDWRYLVDRSHFDALPSRSLSTTSAVSEPDALEGWE